MVSHLLSICLPVNTEESRSLLTSDVEEQTTSIAIVCSNTNDVIFNHINKVFVCPVWARERCRISAPRFLAECRKKRLNQASFVLLCFVLFFFGVMFSFCSVRFFNLFSVPHFPACTDVNGTV